MNKVRFHEMLPHEMVARRSAFPVAFIGLGILEWHGHHLALGNDALKAEKVCEMAAERSGGFLMPTVWWGERRTDRLLEFDDIPRGGHVARIMGLKKEKLADKGYFRKSVEEQMRFYEDLLFHILIELNVYELRAVCIYCGHGPITYEATRVAQRFNAEFADMKVFAGGEIAYAKLAGTEPMESDHAGFWETSMLSYLRPDCVDMAMLHTPDMPMVGVDEGAVDGTIEHGRRMANQIAGGMVIKARELLASQEDAR
jgi:creatinine amidohydrolase